MKIYKKFVMLLKLLYCENYRIKRIRDLESGAARRENAMLPYCSEKAKLFKASTVWAQYSMVKACVQVHDNVNINKYCKLVSFLKRNSDRYQAKRRKVLARNENESFLLTANDNQYRMIKLKT